MEPEDTVALLAQRMAKLPAVQRKVLAMYYYEKMQLRDIATCFGSTESTMCQIHLQAVASLRSFFYNVKSQREDVALCVVREAATGSSSTLILSAVVPPPRNRKLFPSQNVEE
jgi:hypothetical protein